jgi:hypothetical protein
MEKLLTILLAGTSCFGTTRSVTAEPVTVAGDASIPNPRQPQAAVAPDGNIFITFGAAEAIYCSRSLDNGESFSAPVKVASVPRLALGLRRGPRIVAGSNVVVVTAISHDGGSLLSWRSTDGGESWHDSLRVNDTPRVAREGLHAMAISPQGDIFCCWLDLRHDGTEIFGSLSTDGGKSWSENGRVYPSPSGSV